MNTISHNPRSRGFTLIEIMLVVGIITVITGAAIYLMAGNVDFAKEQRVYTDIQSISTQLKLYEIQNYSPPTTNQGIKALVDKPTSPPVPPRWRQLMTNMPLDPWGSPYQYRYPGTKNPKGFDLYSFGPDRKESEDDIGNWKNPS
jgi:general secretion pathway protein G